MLTLAVRLRAARLDPVPAKPLSRVAPQHKGIRWLPVAEKKRTPAELQARKGGVPIVCLTAYSAPIGAVLDPVGRPAAGGRVRWAWWSMASTAPCR